MQTFIDGQQKLDTAVGYLAPKTIALALIRAENERRKATLGFTEGDTKSLGVYATPETLTPNIYQPTIESRARHACVDLMVKKQGVDSLTMYWPLAGTPNWMLHRAKRFRFPFHDGTPAPAPEAMHTRENMATRVGGDDEIGNPSNTGGVMFQF